jgi:hypothetical protein
MGWLVFSIILALIGLVCLAFIPFVDEVKTDEYSKETKNLRPVFGIVGGGLLALALLFYAVGGMKSVPTKSIGVPVAFGKIVGSPYGPGLHETWKPWLGLAIVDETIQTTTFEVDQKTGQGGLDVRIGGQQTARLDITIQWRVKDVAADQLFLNYANKNIDLMDEVRNAVVVRSLKQVANQAMGDYNPIQDVSVNSTAGNSQFSTFGPKIKAGMIHDIGGRIDVTSLILPLAHYDRATQTRLNNIQAQYAETAIARQQYNTNVAQAKANDALRKSVQSDPNVLRAICLNIVRDAMKNSYQLPAGFGCLGDSSSVAVLGK